MERLPRVSIIVIIYKVERFLDQCLKSIVSQSYDDIEIICVVGKGDLECERISRDYAKEDDRVVLLIEEPKGTAAARNSGLRAATGDYIAFVDGDDYIEPDMIEVMVGAALRNDCDISITGRFYDYKNRIDGYGVDEDRELLLKKDEAFEIILYQRGFFLHIWDKLYRKSLFLDISFDEGKKVEDRIVVFELLSKARGIVYNTAPKYHFRVSRDSGSRVEDNLLNSLETDKIIAKGILKEYPKLSDAVEYFMVYETMSLIQNSMLYGSFSGKHDKRELAYVRKHSFNIYKNKKVSRGVKLKTFLCSFFPFILKAMTIKRRKAFLEEHEEFSTGADWQKTFKEQGIRNDI
ncbi:MAG: glycosyltransferase [Lachnospiraceae bacterium]|nr:glycosyltransferase [Lachnospiraceae bacterium]